MLPSFPARPAARPLAAYTLADFAALVGKSPALLYRRLTEKPRHYVLRFARREGERWVFDRALVDAAVGRGESLLIRAESAVQVDTATALSYITRQSRPRGGLT